MSETDKDCDDMDALQKLLSQDIQTLREWIEEVSQEIDSRKVLKHELMSRLLASVEDVQSLVYDISHWEPGYRPSVDGRRTGLEKECLALKREERLQEFNAWRDISILKRQLRELLKEYREALRRMDVIGYQV